MVSKPSISVNKLAEYIESKGGRQRQILRQRKYPDDDFNPGMFHREATEAIARYLADGAVDASILDNAHKSLSQLKPEKVGTARRINANIDAIERFQDMLDEIDLDGVDASLTAISAPKLVYHNVEISVRPELYLRFEGKKGKKFVGAIKLHFSASHPFSDDMAGYVSAVTQEFLKTHIIADGETVGPEHCLVIDTASKRVFPGVKSTTQRLKDVAAECQNIAGIWPTI